MNDNPNLTEPPIFCGPEKLGYLKVQYLGIVKLSATDPRKPVTVRGERVVKFTGYVYQEITKDGPDPYWYVVLTKNSRGKNNWQWVEMDPDMPCPCCGEPLLTQLAAPDTADHPCADWHRWDHNLSKWICSCCWNKKN